MIRTHAGAIDAGSSAPSDAEPAGTAVYLDLAAPALPVVMIMLNVEYGGSHRSTCQPLGFLSVVWP